MDQAGVGASHNLPQRVGRYELREWIKGGGFGDVYRAYDPSIPRDVALKLLRKADDPILLKFFRQEAAAAGNLSHENIVTVFDSGEVDGIPYIVMELLDGQDLGARVSDRLNLTESLEIMRQVCRGLGYAHQSGVLHRDIKPSNIRLTSSGVVKIMDFGIARYSRPETFLSSPTETPIVGTLRYMSPEQLRGDNLDFRSGIFSLGIVFSGVST